MSWTIFVASLYQQLRNKQSLKENPKIQNNQVLFNIRVKTKTKIQSLCCKKRWWQKTRISNIRQTDKKGSHEKPKRTNIQNAVTNNISRKTKNVQQSNIWLKKLNEKKPTGSKPCRKNFKTNPLFAWKGKLKNRIPIYSI